MTDRESNVSIQASPKVFLAVPAYGQMVTSTTTSSLIALSRVLWMNGYDGGFGTLSYPDIVEIRNIFLSIWYDRIQTSHMLFIDADMGFPPELILDMIKCNRPLVGALCPKKKLPIEFAGRAKSGNAKIVNGFMEVNGVGGAVMLISREVVTAMLQKFPEINDTVTVKNHAAKQILDGQGVTRLIKAFNKISIDGEEFSEDLSFCHRWNQCGGDVWANIMHPISHVGMYEYTGAYYNQIKDNIQPEGAVAQPLSPLSTVSAEVIGSIAEKNAEIAAKYNGAAHPV